MGLNINSEPLKADDAKLIAFKAKQMRKAKLSRKLIVDGRRWSKPITKPIGNDQLPGSNDDLDIEPTISGKPWVSTDITSQLNIESWAEDDVRFAIRQHKDSGLTTWLAKASDRVSCTMCADGHPIMCLRYKCQCNEPDCTLECRYIYCDLRHIVHKDTAGTHPQIAPKPARRGIPANIKVAICELAIGEGKKPSRVLKDLAEMMPGADLPSLRQCQNFIHRLKQKGGCSGPGHPF
ncbi:hypothetical protein J8273_7363 [Carpediemonas membranifera]|uniref:Uncharacterized protein n=1 Tax=Carpediemonas membranifera TaxID=201153 RepID=A0A8J6DXW1_9EUKA|nr:hypothetical protein J8273_7363 [Carpediemonas membranifera]|eukprot:KAG9391089.1 hypothetical protein J8273_7363 [Carpediemonas membranifera]